MSGHELVPGVAPEPVAAAGCDVCGALVAQREKARAAGQTERVLSYNRELENHPHPVAVRRRRGGTR